MIPRQLWVTIITALALLAAGPSGVRADPQANCSAGWEWVCSAIPPRPGRDAYGVVCFCPHLRVVHALCRIGIPWGKIRVSLFLYLRPRVNNRVRTSHISLELSETSSSDLEYSLALLIQVRIISHRSTAQTPAMALPSQTHQTSRVNATPSPTGAPPFIARC